MQTSLRRFVLPLHTRVNVHAFMLTTWCLAPLLLVGRRHRDRVVRRGLGLIIGAPSPHPPYKPRARTHTRPALSLRRVRLLRVRQPQLAHRPVRQACLVRTDATPLNGAGPTRDVNISQISSPASAT